MEVSEITNWLWHEMTPNKWYNITDKQYKIIRSVLPYISDDIEITFSSDNSKVRKTIWKLDKDNWKPKL